MWNHKSTTGDQDISTQQVFILSSKIMGFNDREQAPPFPPSEILGDKTQNIINKQIQVFMKKTMSSPNIISQILQLSF